MINIMQKFPGFGQYPSVQYLGQGSWVKGSSCCKYYILKISIILSNTGLHAIEMLTPILVGPQRQVYKQVRDVGSKLLTTMQADSCTSQTLTSLGQQLKTNIILTFIKTAISRSYVNVAWGAAMHFCHFSSLLMHIYRSFHSPGVDLNLVVKWGENVLKWSQMTGNALEMIIIYFYAGNINTHR